MSGGILTRWPVVREVATEPGDLDPERRPARAALDRWFADTLAAYLERCPGLQALLADGSLRLLPSPLAFDRLVPLPVGSVVLVAISVTELRPSSFDLAVRLRGVGEGDPGAANGRCRVTLGDGPDGTPVTIPDPVRRELIAAEAGASSYC